MLMYGVIFSDSYNAICKCINQGYKTKTICTAHNTQGQNIEKFESIIDICISRNYLGMRKYPPTIKDFRSKCILYCFLHKRIMFKSLNTEEWNICVTMVHIKDSFEIILLENLLLLLFHLECQESLHNIFYSHFNYPVALEIRSSVKCSFYLRESIQYLPSYTIIIIISFDIECFMLSYFLIPCLEKQVHFFRQNIRSYYLTFTSYT